MHWLVPVWRAETPPSDTREAQRGTPNTASRQSADWPTGLVIPPGGGHLFSVAGQYAPSPPAMRGDGPRELWHQ